MKGKRRDSIPRPKAEKQFDVAGNELFVGDVVWFTSTSGLGIEPGVIEELDYKYKNGSYSNRLKIKILSIKTKKEIPEAKPLRLEPNWTIKQMNINDKLIVMGF
jgi:hypothetical protein